MTLTTWLLWWWLGSGVIREAPAETLGVHIGNPVVKWGEDRRDLGTPGFRRAGPPGALTPR